MEKRRLGRTGHYSTVMIFGAAAFWEISPEDASSALDLVRAHGVNHIDVAPSYGQAEARLGPWLATRKHRSEVFLGCKTYERSRPAAYDELRRSLERLRVDHFDLYQLHAVGEMEELDKALGPNGSLEAILQAREEGLLKFIGITGHGYHAPAVHAVALERFDFDTVMTSLNFVQWADPYFRESAERLLSLAAQKDVGVMVIKAVTRGPWGERPHRYHTWYEPFEAQADIEKGIRFALSLSVTGFASPGDVRLLPQAIAAAESFRPMSPEEQEALVNSAGAYQPLFAPA
jgi:aryl-alcohol dehydrogenase-like predicted oxidoreductase